MILIYFFLLFFFFFWKLTILIMDLLDWYSNFLIFSLIFSIFLSFCSNFVYGWSMSTMSFTVGGDMVMWLGSFRGISYICIFRFFLFLLAF